MKKKSKEILKNSNDFLENVFSSLKTFGIDVSRYELDHIAYQSSSTEDYYSLKECFKDIGELLKESVVGDRKVGIYKLYRSVKYKNYSIPVIELVEPKQGQVCPSALEHVEFVIDENFDSFMKRYPNIEFDTSAINQKGFPMLKLKLGENIQVKFHLKSVLDIINAE